MVLSPKPAQADLVEDCITILNNAQLAFSELFPIEPATQFDEPWCYRAYPNAITETTLYAGINLNDAGVYLLGPPYGDTPYFVGKALEVKALLSKELAAINTRKEAICDTSHSDITGISSILKNNKLLITSQGACVQPPENNNLCDAVPPRDANGNKLATGVNVLIESSIDSLVFPDFELPTIPGLPSIPGFSNPLGSFLQGFDNQTCLVHALEDMTKYTIETDICMDMTDTIGYIPRIKHPVTIEFKGQSLSTVVDDCFLTDADSITNLLTGQAWKNQAGSFVPAN